ncbi:hypothetical protein DXG03_004429, partial [Asterophora parasitica]
NIPLVLETPSFEQPQKTWAKEIEVLNRLSGLTLDEPGADTQMDELVNGIKTAVLHAEKNGKGKSKTKAPGRTSKKRKADDEGDEDEEE